MEDKQQVAGWGKGWDLERKEELMGQWGVLCLSQSDLKCASAKVGNWWVSPQQWLQEGARVGWTLLFTFPSGTPFPLDSFREPTKDGTTGCCSWGLASQGVPSLQPPTSICPLCWVLPATLQPPPPGKQPFLSSASLQGCCPDTLGSSVLHLLAAEQRRWYKLGVSGPKVLQTVPGAGYSGSTGSWCFEGWVGAQLDTVEVKGTWWERRMGAHGAAGEKPALCVDN